jgi:hypothetical protein
VSAIVYAFGYRVDTCSGWESIANGAVQCELLGIQNLISVRIARYNLGMLCVGKCDLKQNRKQGQFRRESYQEDTAANQIWWCLKRVSQSPLPPPGFTFHSLQGSEVKPDTLFKFHFERTIPKDTITSGADKVETKVQIVRSDDDDAPPYITSGTVSSPIPCPKPPNHKNLCTLKN